MAIKVQNLGKAYPIFTSKLQTIATWLGLKQRQQNWILRNVSFEVKQGEAVGIIGINGAGKSTLLKMIAGTSIPSEGTIQIDGKISALLELGIGFHPELTGRQNAFLACRMQGMELPEIHKLIPHIEQFAEIGNYFEQSVRTYSSGMFVRLAFAVATAMRPEILIVDEALSVGDAYFQHKSFAKIREFRDLGSTLLFVSHDNGAIKSICDRAILINKGGIIMDDEPSKVLDFYNALIADKNSKYDEVYQTNSANISENENIDIEQNSTSNLKNFLGRSGNKKAEILDITLINSKNQANSTMITCGESIKIQIKFIVREKLQNLSVGIDFKNRLGEIMFGTNTEQRKELKNIGQQIGEHTVEILVKNLFFGTGNYKITAALHAGDSHVEENYDWIDGAAMFEVVPNNSDKAFIGMCNLDVDIKEINEK